jgi:hypothetical protein
MPLANAEDRLLGPFVLSPFTPFDIFIFLFFPAAGNAAIPFMYFFMTDH